MAGRRQEKLLNLLADEPGWHTASRLANRLQVSDRTVRTYVTALNDAVEGTAVITSGPAGYQAVPDGVAAWRQVQDSNGSSRATDAPRRDRLHRVVRSLSESEIDVFELAERLHVSEATLDADLARVRSLIREVGDLRLVRTGSRLHLEGDELARRRMLTALVQDELSEASFDLRRLADAAGEDTVSSEDLARFRDALAAELSAMGFFVNEYAVADLALQVTITVGRVRRGRPLGATAQRRADQDGDHAKLADVVGQLASSELGTELGTGDRDYLASVLRTRVVVPDAARRAVVVPAAVDEAVRSAVDHVRSEYGVDLSGQEFLTRLSLHVHHLVQRAGEGAITRNPLTRSLKATYPMIFEIAVALVGEIGERLGLAVDDDEIAYVSMHIGGELERGRARETRLSATIVCPGYYELHELLRSSVTRSLGHDLEIVEVVTRIDPDWERIGTDLILTTIDPPAPTDRIVRIRPFLTEADVDRVNRAASQVRRSRRQVRMRAELQRYFSERTYVPDLPDAGQEATIRHLGGLLVEQGIIDAAHVEAAIAREAMSSTAFTESMAMPHSMAMTASRTALAVGVSGAGVNWGGQRVQVVVFAAFSETDREAFQTVFEQFVTAFSAPEQVHALVKNAPTLSAFLDGVTALVDS